MLGKPLRKRILDKKLLDQKNTYQDLKRIRDKSKLAIRDLILIAEKMDEKYLKEIFTEKEMGLFIRKILKPHTKRTIMITEAVSWEVWQKLSLTLPRDMVTSLASDISKTHTYAKLLSQYADKPMLKQTYKNNSKVYLGELR